EGARKNRRDESGARFHSPRIRGRPVALVAPFGGKDSGASPVRSLSPRKSRASGGIEESGRQRSRGVGEEAAGGLRQAPDRRRGQGAFRRRRSGLQVGVVLDGGAQAQTAPGVRQREDGDGRLARERWRRRRVDSTGVRRGFGRKEDRDRTASRQALQGSVAGFRARAGGASAARRGGSAGARLGALTSRTEARAGGARGVSTGGVSRRREHADASVGDRRSRRAFAGARRRPSGPRRLAGDLHRSVPPRRGPARSLQHLRAASGRPAAGPLAADLPVAASGTARLRLALRDRGSGGGRPAGPLLQSPRRSAPGRILGRAGAGEGVLRPGRSRGVSRPGGSGGGEGARDAR